MTRQAISVAAALMVGCAASSASAQESSTAGAESSRVSAATAVRAGRTAVGRGYVSVNALYQVTSTNFADHWAVPYYLESESLNASYSVKPAVVIDVGAGYRVWRNLTVGAFFSRYHRSEPASLTATVPHPLLYKQPRSFSGTATGPARTEAAVHANAMWLARAGSRIVVGVFGGPSFYSLKQVIVSGVTFAEAYPYTTLTLDSTAKQTQTKSRIGFNAGCDMTVRLRKQIGVGLLVRYTGLAGGQVVPVAGNAPSGINQSPEAGGLQVGGGLRLRF